MPSNIAISIKVTWLYDNNKMKLSRRAIKTSVKPKQDEQETVNDDAPAPKVSGTY